MRYQVIGHTHAALGIAALLAVAGCDRDKTLSTLGQEGRATCSVTPQSPAAGASFAAAVTGLNRKKSVHFIVHHPDGTRERSDALRPDSQGRAEYGSLANHGTGSGQVVVQQADRRGRRLASCRFEVIAPPCTDCEPQAEICDNGLDDDEDGATDCADADCSAHPSCAPPPAEICDNGLDDDEDGATDCADADCSAHPSCAPPPAEICDNGLDDDKDGATDCADADCSAHPSCAPPPAEICDNGLDDDEDGATDCADADCSAHPSCAPPPAEICDNGLDDDEDGATDCADADCSAHPSCNAGCNDDCALGESRCLSATGRQVCGNYDADTCLDWGPAANCPAGSRCEAGACQLSCNNTCPLPGLKRCSADGASVQICGDLDGDRCLEWSDATACPSSCANGACSAPGCTNDCSAPGKVRCSPDGAGREICQDTGSGCLSWAPIAACPTDRTCSRGNCYATVRHECRLGMSRCDPYADGVQQCATSASGQLKWSQSARCPAGAPCTWGACRTSCTDQCLVGDRRCMSGEGFQRCGQYDDDGCLEWPSNGATESCATDSSCVDGRCEANQAAGQHTMPFFWEGANRTYDVYVPRVYAAQQPAGVMLALHGSCEAGEREVAHARWDVPAESHNILVIAPDGPRHISSTSPAYAPSPSARCWEIGPRSEVEKQALYLRAMLEDARGNYAIDSEKVHSFGFSGGGYIACHLAMFHSDVVKGVGLNGSECNYRNTDVDFISQQIPFYFIAGESDHLLQPWITPEFNYLKDNGYRTTLVVKPGAGHTYFPGDMDQMWRYLTAAP